MDGDLGPQWVICKTIKERLGFINILLVCELLSGQENSLEKAGRWGVPSTKDKNGHSNTSETGLNQWHQFHFVPLSEL